MCTLIYATVPSRSDLGRIRSTLRLVPAADPVVTARLRPGEQLCTVAGVPHCSGGGHCGTVLGRARPRGQGSHERDARHVGRLRKRGWSEHKIDVWLEQRRRVQQPPNMNGEVDELGLWNELLQAALEEARMGFVGLMVFNAGDEPELPVRCEAISRTACELTRLEPGVLYRIARAWPWPAVQL